MFFKPRFWQKDKPVSLAAHCHVTGAEGYEKALLSELAACGKGELGISEIRVESHLPDFYPLDHREEGYAIEITERTATLWGETPRGRIYAAVTLLQMANHGELCTGRLYDAPDCAFRGYRANLPSRQGFDHFYKMVDTLVYYKYNALSLEIGGAMEYKRHPRINEVWREFAAETHRYSGRTEEIQNSCEWSKNSIHTENAEGDILTQDEVRSLIAYARARGLEVYPEAPTLSHSDYICMAYPELAERADDPYPDTYCPNHPDTYGVVFDILEEILAVFEPKVVNIGHDELYTACVCPRCKGLYPDEVYAADITKIHDFLAERGVRTMMWAEKLLPVVTPNGRRYGGAGGRYIRRDGKELAPHPVLFYCQTKLPKDILMLHWYYSFGIQYDYVYHVNGYTALYGNLSARLVKEWRRRRQLGMKGGAVSNWGSTDPIYMQRNAQYFDLVFSAYALWSADYDDPQLAHLERETFRECFHRKYGSPKEGHYIAVTHTTELSLPYRPFHCGIFIDEDTYRLGDYLLRYTDGEEVRFPVIYGENISSSSLACSFGEDDTEFDPDTLCESALYEISYSTVPHAEDGLTYYTTLYRNPHPEKEIESFTYLPRRDAALTVKHIDYHYGKED